MNERQVILDIELYPNYLLIGFRNYVGGIKYFEKWNDSELDTEGIKRILEAAETITFNGNGYDFPIMTLALSGANNATLKQASDAIIVEQLRPWDFYKRYGLREPKWNHIDLIEPAPAVKISLKLYGGRLHSKRLQDLPISPDELITEDNHDILVSYWKNDLATTVDLLHAIEDRIDLRRNMSKEYGIDLRSKSDAQIAETIIKQQVEKITGEKVRKRKVCRRVFQYQKPEFIKFESEQLNNILKIFETSDFIAETNGVITMSQELPIVSLGTTKYSLGIGGIHSIEHEVFHKSDDDIALFDIDAKAFYPTTIMALGLYPEALGEDFLTVYKSFIDMRMEAKRTKNKLVDSSSKIFLNGSYGKLGSIYSILFAPNLLIQTTITGQLVLIMLAERLEKYGVSVVSANTDGIVVKCPRKYIETRMKPIISAWEKLTSYEMEFTEYEGIYNRDVNSYVAIKADGKAKAKGFFASGGLQKSPTNEVCSKAFIEYLKHGTPIEDAIRGCTDIRDFLSIRTVKGGAVKDSEYLGKAIRWYYAVGIEGTINYKSNGNTVPRTEGAKPCMILPDEFPNDINYEWYIKEANDMLMDVGLVKRPKPAKIPRRNCKAWVELVEKGYLILVGEDYVWYDEVDLTTN